MLVLGGISENKRPSCEFFIVDYSTLNKKANKFLLKEKNDSYLKTKLPRGLESIRIPPVLVAEQSKSDRTKTHAKSQSESTSSSNGRLLSSAEERKNDKLRYPSKT